MVSNPPEGFPQVTPYLLYEDVDATVDWLVDVFGFAERYRMPGPDGKTSHAELQMGAGVVMMGNPGPDYKNPKHTAAVTQLVFVYVDDVDKHHQRALSKGAEVVRPLADQFYGDRVYGVLDPEGHHWQFAQHVKDVAAEDMHP